MAGAKETPRQKMIGLMYLVLMALLALNVTQAVLDAFVAIEDNMQKACIKQLDRGNESIDIIKEELSDRTNPLKVQKVKYFLGIIQKIDTETAQMIKEIDEVKMDILVKSGENITTEKENDLHSVLWKKYSKDNPLLPVRFNLSAIEGKDQYDIPMHEIIGEDLTNITGSGKKLWKNYNTFREKICHLVGTYEFGEKKYAFNPKTINKFKDNNDLNLQVEKMLASNPINVSEDKEVLKLLYTELSKNERYDTEEVKNIHWIGKTFDHSPIVAALASLTSLQQEVLTARATALNHIKTKISVGEYSFNKVVALAYGPASANVGDDVEIKVMMAAYDSDNQPVITVNDRPISNVKDGYGIVKVKANGNSEMTVRGKISIRKKSGEIKTEDWQTNVVILKPQGTISIPAYNILYRGYPNEVEAVASGFDETKLIPTGNGTSISKKGDKYVVDPGTGKNCSLTIQGINKTSKKTVTLGTYNYRVAGIPTPLLYFGSFNNAKVPASVVKAIRKLRNAYDASVPLNINFITKDWTITNQNMTAPPVSGSGEVLNQKAIDYIRMARPGHKLVIVSKYVGAKSSAYSTCFIDIQ